MTSFQTRGLRQVPCCQAPMRRGAWTNNSRSRLKNSEERYAQPRAESSGLKPELQAVQAGPGQALLLLPALAEVVRAVAETVRSVLSRGGFVTAEILL